ncbi:hypothetical protein ACFYZ2_22365 [Streptomyces sviceus]
MFAAVDFLEAENFSAVERNWPHRSPADPLGIKVALSLMTLRTFMSTQ